MGKILAESGALRSTVEFIWEERICWPKKKTLALANWPRLQKGAPSSPFPEDDLASSLLPAQWAQTERHLGVIDVVNFCLNR